MAVGEKIVDGAVDSVGYAAKDGLKTFLTVALVVGGLLGLAAGAGVFATLGLAGAIGVGVGTALVSGLGLGWLAGTVGAAWGLVTGPFRGAKERRLEREDNPALSQGASKEQELEALRAQNQNARTQLNEMGNEMMQAAAQQEAARKAALNSQPTQQQLLALKAGENAGIDGGSQAQLPEDGFAAAEIRRGGGNSSQLSNLAAEQNKKFVETLALPAKSTNVRTFP